jgi:hypothetical protein
MRYLEIKNRVNYPCRIQGVAHKAVIKYLYHKTFEQCLPDSRWVAIVTMSDTEGLLQ